MKSDGKKEKKRERNRERPLRVGGGASKRPVWVFFCLFSDVDLFVCL